MKFLPNYWPRYCQGKVENIDIASVVLYWSPKDMNFDVFNMSNEGVNLGECNVSTEDVSL